MLSTFLEQFGKPLGVGAVCSVAFGFFAVADTVSAPQARADFARYLRSTEFAKAVVHLPDDTRALFERMFGPRHFSSRCVKTSIVFSLVAFAFVLALSVLDDPKQTRFWVLEVRKIYPALAYILLAYAVWAIVPDYFNLLKTRKILDLITARQISRPSVLAVILIADFLLGYAIFILTCLPMGLFTDHLVFFLMGQVNWHHVISNFGFSPLPWSAGFERPYAVFFWPGMVPSIWLWAYMGATLIVRLAVRSAPVLRFSNYFLDIDQHPIRSVGSVAAVLVGFAYIVLLVIFRFAELFDAT
jgi:hypothetical protein